MKTTAPRSNRNTPAAQAFNAEVIRSQFPALSRTVHDCPLVYLDSSATTQKPQCVIDAMVHFYSYTNANVHRGVHLMSQESTLAFDAVRNKVRQFINAADEREIIFSRGTTESINLVAHSWGLANLKEGDEIILSGMEHHSDIVPWQMVCQQTGAIIKPIPILDDGSLDMAAYGSLLNDRTKLVCCVHVSNALGTINPVKEMTAKAHAVGALVLLDGAQSLSHLTVDVRDIDCDFFATSSHKWFGPTGIGFLYGRRELLEAMPPFLGGGDMIRSVTFEKTTYNTLPNKLEAGTPNIGGVIGMGAAIDFLARQDMGAVGAYERELLHYGTNLLNNIEGVRIIGTSPNKASVLSFVVDNIHPHDIGTILDQQGIAVRTGHHCTQPLMERFGVPATTRASLAMYNTLSDLDALSNGLQQVIEVFK